MLLPKNIHSSWNDFLTQDILNELQNIELEIGSDFVPKKENILRFMQNDLMSIKVGLVAQDPYYSVYKDEDGNELPVANGRSFQPDLLKNWQDSFSQKSLQNIVRLIHKTYNNIEDYNKIKTFSDIRAEILDGKFPILQPYEWFDSLENQGVLFLNTYFTTIKGKGNAHRNIWNDFSQKLITYISTKNSNISWFLWGNEAIKIEKYIVNGIYYKSNHPTFCSKKYENDFLKSDCFKNTMHEINWLGIK